MSLIYLFCINKEILLSLYVLFYTTPTFELVGKFLQVYIKHESCVSYDAMDAKRED